MSTITNTISEHRGVRRAIAAILGCQVKVLLFVFLCTCGRVAADETYCFMVYSGSTYYYMRSAGVDGSAVSTVSTNQFDEALAFWTFSGTNDVGQTGWLRCGSLYLNVNLDGELITSTTPRTWTRTAYGFSYADGSTYYVGINGSGTFVRTESEASSHTAYFRTSNGHTAAVIPSSHSGLTSVTSASAVLTFSATTVLTVTVSDESFSANVCDGYNEYTFTCGSDAPHAYKTDAGNWTFVRPAATSKTFTLDHFEWSSGAFELDLDGGATTPAATRVKTVRYRNMYSNVDTLPVTVEVYAVYRAAGVAAGVNSNRVNTTVRLAGYPQLTTNWNDGPFSLYKFRNEQTFNGFDAYPVASYDGNIALLSTSQKIEDVYYWYITDAGGDTVDSRGVHHRYYYIRSFGNDGYLCIPTPSDTNLGSVHITSDDGPSTVLTNANKFAIIPIDGENDRFAIIAKGSRYGIGIPAVAGGDETYVLKQVPLTDHRSHWYLVDTLTMTPVTIPDTVVPLDIVFHGGALSPDSKTLTNDASDHGVSVGDVAEIPYGDTVTFTVSGYYYTCDSVHYPEQQRFDYPDGTQYYYYEDEVHGIYENGLVPLHGDTTAGVVHHTDGLTYRWRITGGGLDGKVQILKSDGSWAALGEWVNTGAVNSVKVCMTHGNRTITNLNGILEVRAMRNVDSSHRLQAVLTAKRDHEHPIGFTASPTSLAVGTRAPSDTGVVTLELYTPYIGNASENTHAEWVVTSSNTTGLEIIPPAISHNVMRCNVQRHDTLVGTTSFKVVGHVDGQYSVDILLKSQSGATVGHQIISVEVNSVCSVPVIINTSTNLITVDAGSPYAGGYLTAKYFMGRIRSSYPANDTVYLRIVQGDQRSSTAPAARDIVAGWTANTYTTAPTVGNPAHYCFASGSVAPVFMGHTVYAVAVKKGFDTSAVACFYFGGGETPDEPYIITNTYDFSYMAAHPTYHYVQSADIDVHDVMSDFADSAAMLSFLRGLTVSNFRGTFNGNYYKLKNIVHPLMDTISGRGSVSNLILEDVWIDDQSASTSLGAIARVACEGARIYNVGSRTTDNFVVGGQLRHRGRVTSAATASQTFVGGLVGRLLDTARVINCYSDADVVNRSTSTSSHTAGLVGYNGVATTQTDLLARKGTMVMNCVCYADSVKGEGVKNTGSLAPVYGGKPISNDKIVSSKNVGVNTYTYYCADMAITRNNGTVVANADHFFSGSLQMSDMNFGRWLPTNILNSNRRLCAVYIITDRRTSATGDWVAEYPEDTSYVGKWVKDDEYYYPVIKKWGKYPSLIRPRITSDAEFRAPYCGRKLGELTVHVRGKRVDQTTAINQDLVLPIMDIDTGDAKSSWGNGFGAGKYGYAYVSLPFYSSMFTDGYGVSGNNRTVTGWKITAVETDGTVEYHHFTTTGDTSCYNFADRYCIDKDIFDTMNRKFGIPRVFACGGYYYVPEGVTAITIEPYWSRYTVYICDRYTDRVASKNAPKTQNIFYYGGHLPNASRTYLGKAVLYNTKAVMDDLNSNGYNGDSACVYDNAVVLVGNYTDSVMSAAANNGTTWTTTNKKTPFTVLSANDNQDDEPAYTLYCYIPGRLDINPVCFTFVNICGIGQAKKTMNQQFSYTIGIWRPNGWFEITETAFAEFNQFEYAHASKQAKIYNRTSPLILNGGTFHDIVSSQKNPLNTPYVILGGNVFMDRFAHGAHYDANKGSDHFKTPHNPVSIVGGQFAVVYLSGMDPAEASNANDHVQLYTNGGKIGLYATGGQAQIDGNACLRIDHTVANSFYGGGINPSKLVTGNIDVRLTNCLIGTYFGGPQNGDMTSSQRVTTYAENTTFGFFYGAGCGGSSITTARADDASGNNISFNCFYNNRLSYASTASGTVGNCNITLPGYCVDYDYDFMFGSQGNTFWKRFYKKYATVSLAQTFNVTSHLKKCTVLSDFYGGGRFGAVGTAGTPGVINTTLDSTEVFGRVFGGSYASSIPTVEVSLLTSANVNTYKPTYNDSTGYFGPHIYAPKETWTWKAGTNGTKDNTNKILETSVDLSNLGQVYGNINLTIKGTSNIHGDVFGGCDMSTATANVVTRITGPVHIGGSVYGGGNEAKVRGNTNVRIGAD